MTDGARKAQHTERRRVRGRDSRERGHRGEWIAALWLMLKGYRILGFRVRTAFGEVDLLARRGPVLAVVEVKLRATLESALEALTPAQAERLEGASRTLAARPGLRALT